MTTLKLYRCHKEVLAGKITKISKNEVGALMHVEAVIPTVIEVSNDYLNKHRPQEGGYYVKYEDGYESFSPAAAFESGYTLVA